jgi:hypothetical protein
MMFCGLHLTETQQHARNHMTQGLRFVYCSDASSFVNFRLFLLELICTIILYTQKSCIISAASLLHLQSTWLPILKRVSEHTAHKEGNEFLIWQCGRILITAMDATLDPCGTGYHDCLLLSPMCLPVKTIYI